MGAFRARIRKERMLLCAPPTNELDPPTSSTHCRHSGQKIYVDMSTWNWGGKVCLFSLVKDGLSI
jgi:hypothetical protein